MCCEMFGFSKFFNVCMDLFSASLEYEMMLDFLIKSSTESGEKNLAVPFVGST